MRVMVPTAARGVLLLTLGAPGCSSPKTAGDGAPAGHAVRADDGIIAGDDHAMGDPWAQGDGSGAGDGRSGSDAAPIPSDEEIGGDGMVPGDAPTSTGDAWGGGPRGLTDLRTDLLVTMDFQSPSVCDTWNSLEASQRAIFLTLTHRLHISRTPDVGSMLDHMTRLWVIVGGGIDGTECSGREFNRLFLSMDPYLWQLMLDTNGGTRNITDGGGSTWQHTRDIAGPHDPFNASNETDIGLRCVLLVELGSSQPPTAQAHFFRPGDEAPVVRAPFVDLPADPYMLEIDHDFSCTHRSNPICPGKGYDTEYVDNYGDFDCRWVPPICVATSSDCYGGAVATP